MRKYLSAAVSLLFFSGLPFGASGEVNWLFQVGGMYMKQYGAEGKFFNYETGEREKGKSFEATAGLYLQIPVSKSVPVYIETGLGYRNKLVLSQAKGFKFKPSLIEEDWLPDEGDLDYYRGKREWRSAACRFDCIGGLSSPLHEFRLFICQPGVRQRAAKLLH